MVAAASPAAAMPAPAPLLAPSPTPAPASTDDDVRCLLLSASFAQAAKEDGPRRGAAMIGAFYLGRLSGRLSQAALATAVRAQGKGLPAAQAESLMRACGARAQAVEQAMTGGIRAVQAGH
jgi:hypothetical protein